MIRISVLLALALVVLCGCKSPHHVIKVVDATGQPVVGTEVAITYLGIFPPGLRPDEPSSLTDHSGAVDIAVELPDSAILSVEGGTVSFSELANAKGRRKDVYKTSEAVIEKTGLKLILEKAPQ